ncbi:MAG: hypothetical protein JO128_07945 [Alphaproteobacteria bacterium]|nr:hypothetical protein [Alphaproteobacteria bacterium]
MNALARTLVLLVAALVIARAAAAADLVVISSRGVSLKPGQAVDGAQPLVLKEGQQVELIAPTGQLIKLHGPWDKPPLGESAAEAPDASVALKALLTTNLARSERVGVVRGAAAQVVPPEPWLVDVTHVGIRCVPENHPIVFWRPDRSGPATVIVEPYDRSWRAHAEWPAGDDRMGLPATLPLTNRSTYIVGLNGKNIPITLVTIPAAASNDAMRAAWMMQQGCDAQAQALLQSAR